MNEIAWCPTKKFAGATRVARFMRHHGIATVQELRAQSASRPNWFYPAIMADLDVPWDKPWTEVFDDSLGMPFTKWFVRGKINIVRACVDRHAKNHGERVALHWEGEDGTRRTMTYRELSDAVTQTATAMRESGVRKGDVIGQIMTSSPEAVVIMFAAMKIGAVPMQIAARTPSDTVTQLLTEANAKMVFVTEDYSHGGKMFCLHQTVRAIEKSLHCEVVVIPHFGGISMQSNKPGKSYEDFLLRAEGKEPAKTLSLDSEDLALILLSSGTTGKPKVIMHTHGGMLVNTAKEIGYAFDYQKGDVFFWVTNLGWMMHPWQVIGVQFFGGTHVLYDGSPTYPTSHRLFEMIERYRVTTFGFSPTGIRSLDKSLDYGAHDLSSLRILGSTGAPLDPETWKWYFEVFGKQCCPIINIMGGTEIMGCLVFSLPIEASVPGTVGGPALGMDVCVVDENGDDLPQGKEGTLVCRNPFPSMTRGFLNDLPRFVQTYFFPWGQNTWNHHDRVRIDERGFWFVCGRDDDLINRGGVKYDPMAIESALRSFFGDIKITDAVAVGVPDEKLGQKIVCFVVVDERSSATSAILENLRRHVGKTYDPSGKPDEIYIVRALPTTLSAKVPRKKYVEAYLGQEVADASSCANGAVFAEISAMTALDISHVSCV